MDIDEPVPLLRRFSPIFQSDVDSDERDVLELLGHTNIKTWEKIDNSYRTVMLAEGGAGKTYEMLARARFVEQQGKRAFFIRIEDIEGDLEDWFHHVGSAGSFNEWFDSLDEAWFYLDSVDEARLRGPDCFTRAIRRFANKIGSAQKRAHVCISSRPHAWRVKSDRDLVQQYLPFAKPLAKQGEAPGDALEILVLLPLEEDDIRLFARCRSVLDIDMLIRELERFNLESLAGRVFDLEEILNKWKADSTLGGRRELLLYSIERRLYEQNPDRALRQTLNPVKVRSGAQALAAAVILTGKANIQVLDNPQTQSGIDPHAVLADWQPAEVHDLLSKAVFDDVVYGAVRFRQRDVREFLAAEWFVELLRGGHSREKIERLIFREQYGADIVAPRLRAVLPWIVLEDSEIRNRILATYPEILVEGGDPALLPFQERKNILAEIVDRIAHSIDVGAAGKTHAIARIAQPDLAAETRSLIEKHVSNDHAVAFLGKLVWQGEMKDCVPELLNLVTDPIRSRSARISAARAVMTCGTDAQKLALWSQVCSVQELPREVLAELLRHAEADTGTVSSLLESIERLAPYRQFHITGLKYAFHGFIDRMSPPQESDLEDHYFHLVTGLNDILNRPPHIESSRSRISEQFSWLLGPAVHSVERLVSVRSKLAFCEPAVAILINAPSALLRHDRDVDDYRDKLNDLVPAWPELNDRLFWKNVESARIRIEGEGGRLNDDWEVQWPEHYWHFDSDSFDRIIEWVSSRELEDDRLVALSLAVRVYQQSKKPFQWLGQLQTTVSNNLVLMQRLDELLNPIESEERRNWRKEEQKFNRKRERRNRKNKKQRLDWISRLKVNPELVRNPPELKPGEISLDQWWLLEEASGDLHRTNRIRGTDWQSLIEEFGEDVAVAYRDATKAYWRQYSPGLRSEGANMNSTPEQITLGLAGLAIEASEVDGFPAHLCQSELRLALRYIFWELNGFPIWLESIYQAHPKAVMEAIEPELLWELAHTKAGQHMRYVVQALSFYTPWLFGPFADWFLDWLQNNNAPTDESLRHILRILYGGCRNPKALATLAQAKAKGGDTSEHQPYWYATWVDADPNKGIEAVTDWLGVLGREEASHAAQLFITALLGNRYEMGVGQRFAESQVPKQLKQLYVLMHEHIRTKEDVNRAGEGVYSPRLRDNAQDDRNLLFKLLSEVPGKEAYIALRDLITDHPDPDRRP